MKFHIRVSALSLFILSAAFVWAQEKPAVDEKPCMVRLAIWENPDPMPDLFVVNGKERTALVANMMSFSYKNRYTGPLQMEIHRRTFSTEKDKQGKPVEVLTPYATVTLPNRGSDIGVVLFPQNNGSSASTQSFDMSEESFPYGSILIKNYTKARVDVIIGKRHGQIEPLGSFRYSAQFPAQSTRALPLKFALSVTEPGSEPVLLASSTAFLYANSRRFLFLMQVPGSTNGQGYRSTVMIENKVLSPSDQTKTNLSDKDSADKKVSPGAPKQPQGQPAR